jgi:hypothetical protein
LLKNVDQKDFNFEKRGKESRSFQRSLLGKNNNEGMKLFTGTFLFSEDVLFQEEHGGLNVSVAFPVFCGSSTALCVSIATCVLISGNVTTNRNNIHE